MDRQADAPDSVLSFYRILLAWRQTLPAIGGMQVEFLDLDEPLLGFRTGGLLCLFNLGCGEVTVTIPDALKADHVQYAVTKEGRCHLGPNGFLLARLIT